MREISGSIAKQRGFRQPMLQSAEETEELRIWAELERTVKRGEALYGSW